MKQDWDIEEIIEHFTLLPPEVSFLGSNDPHNHLGKALLLKFFQQEGRFPESETELPAQIITYVAQQLSLSPEVIKVYQWDGRTIKEHRRQIREWLGFHPATVADQQALQTWLIQEVLPHEHRPAYLEPLVYQRLQQLQIEPPAKGQIARLITAALYQHEQAFFATTAARLPEAAKANLRQLLDKKVDLAAEVELAATDDENPSRYLLHDLKAGPGDAKITNIKKVAERLKLLQQVGLPADLFAAIPLRFLRQYQQQVAVESISHLQRRHETPQAYTLLAAFCWVRQREITDQLVDLFIQILNDIRLRAEQRVERELIGDIIQVDGKQRLLYRLAEAMWNNPKGIIGEVLYPLVGEERLRALVQEAKTKGTYQRSVQTQVTASYTHHYRQMLPPLLEVLTFRSNNEQYKPLLEALAVVTTYLQEQDAFYPVDQAAPMDDVIQKQWQSWIYEQDKAGKRRGALGPGVSATNSVCYRHYVTNCAAKKFG